jgi:hypothetical protein
MFDSPVAVFGEDEFIILSEATIGLAINAVIYLIAGPMLLAIMALRLLKSVR